jgi:hypothetical protein
MTLLVGLIGALVACSCLFVLALCKAAAEADKNRPLHPQRLALVQKAQRELQWQAQFGRERQ